MTRYVWEYNVRYKKITAAEDRSVVITVPNQAVMRIIYGGVIGATRTTTTDTNVTIASPYDSITHKVLNDTSLADGDIIAFPNPDSLSSWGVMLPLMDITYPNQLVFTVKTWAVDELITFVLRAYISLHAKPTITMQSRIEENLVLRHYLVGVTDG